MSSLLLPVTSLTLRWWSSKPSSFSCQLHSYTLSFLLFWLYASHAVWPSIPAPYKLPAVFSSFTLCFSTDFLAGKDEVKCVLYELDSIFLGVASTSSALLRCFFRAGVTSYENPNVWCNDAEFSLKLAVLTKHRETCVAVIVCCCKMSASAWTRHLCDSHTTYWSKVSNYSCLGGRWLLTGTTTGGLAVYSVRHVQKQSDPPLAQG